MIVVGSATHGSMHEEQKRGFDLGCDLRDHRPAQPRTNGEPDEKRDYRLTFRLLSPKRATTSISPPNAAT